jgi:hypothetical protein
VEAPLPTVEDDCAIADAPSSNVAAAAEIRRCVDLMSCLHVAPAPTCDPNVSHVRDVPAFREGTGMATQKMLQNARIKSSRHIKARFHRMRCRSFAKMFFRYEKNTWVT